MLLKRCGYEEVLVLTGCGTRSYVYPREWALIVPGLHKVQKFCLKPISMSIETPSVRTMTDVDLTLTGHAKVKISDTSRARLEAACEFFLGKSNEEIINYATHVISKHQREIAERMTIEEIIYDGKLFTESVINSVKNDMDSVGLEFISYQLKDIREKEGYLETLGKQRLMEKFGVVPVEGSTEELIIHATDSDYNLSDY